MSQDDIDKTPKRSKRPGFRPRFIARDRRPSSTADCPSITARSPSKSCGLGYPIPFAKNSTVMCIFGLINDGAGFADRGHPTVSLDQDRTILTVKDIIENPDFLAKSRATLRRRIAEGTFPAPFYVGRKMGLHRADLEAWLSALKPAAPVATSAGA